MVLYMANKTGTKILSSIVSSPGAFFLTILVNGLLTLTLAAGIGSKDITSITTTIDNNPRSTNNLNNKYNHDVYNCPISCQCEYSGSSQKLEISCSSATTWSDGTSTTSQASTINLSNGVRVLRISQVLLDAKSVPLVVPRVVKNTLVELDLEHVTIEPKSLFTTSGLLEDSKESLRKITIKRGMLAKNEHFVPDIPAIEVRDVLQSLASLLRLDSLNICDSSPSLATIVLQAMPVVYHLRAVNNSLYEIPFDSLIRQYSIQSIDFSRNHIALIPNGLLEGLKDLRTLDVSQNRIFHLQEQVFNGLKSLRKLNISHNQIEYVDAEVFTPLREIQTVDLSHNEVVQFFEPYFVNNKKLEILNMSNMWVTGTFTTSDTASRSLTEMEYLISSLQRVEKLDISENHMRSLPETLTHAPRLTQAYLYGNQWECSCQDRWFLDWVATSKVSIGENNSTQHMWCYSRKNKGEIHKYPFHQYLTNLTMTCTNANIIARTPYKFHAIMGKDKQLNCHAQKPDWPKITWITPSKEHITENSSISNKLLRESQEILGEPRVNPDGSLYLTNVTARDYGLYKCIASYEDLNITHYVHLGMDVSVFRDVRIMSIVVGWITSFAFLAIVLLCQLIKSILYRFGIRCVSASSSQQTRRGRAFFDTMEQNKTTQLDWLRDNYNMQTKKIKDNCYSQLDRLRESYSNQSKNLGEIRDYGTQQLYTLRDQYNDQVRKVASYSAHRLCKVRENYVFKRNQVCKFSSHQLLRIRETYKWQAQTLNKILENLPRGLNFDTCRGMGACGRTDSIYLDDMGDDDFDISQDMQAEVYLTHERNSSIDKMEHVSLLIPPEFVSDYKKIEEGIENQRLDEDDRETAKKDHGNVERLKENEDEFLEAEQGVSENPSSYTPPTLTLKSSVSFELSHPLVNKNNGTNSTVESATIIASTSKSAIAERHSQDV